MKKYFISIFLISFNFFFSQDKNQALSDYLNTISSDYNHGVIIIKEKINSNNTIDIFKGKTYVDSITRKLKRDNREGIKSPLYDEADWIKMKKKYYKNDNDFWLKNDYWVIENFKVEKMIFVSHTLFFDFIFDYTEKHLPIIKAFAFSEPIYYKNKKYLTFIVNEGNTESINGFTNNYLIVMKKVKGKWVVINKSYPLDIYY